MWQELEKEWLKYLLLDDPPHYLPFAFKQTFCTEWIEILINLFNSYWLSLRAGQNAECSEKDTYHSKLLHSQETHSLWRSMTYMQMTHIHVIYAIYKAKNYKLHKKRHMQCIWCGGGSKLLWLGSVSENSVDQVVFTMDWEAQIIFDNIELMRQPLRRNDWMQVRRQWVGSSM